MASPGLPSDMTNGDRERRIFPQVLEYMKMCYLKDQSDLGPPCLLLYLNSSVMLVNYLQQASSADVIFQIGSDQPSLELSF